MLNEPLFKIFIDIFSKVLEVHFVTIVNEFKWRLCTFFEINHAVIWLKFHQNINTLLFKDVLVFFVFRRDPMLMWSNIWSGKNIDKKRTSFLCSMHENLCSYKQLGTFESSDPIEVLHTFEILHVPIFLN